jgi:hypothetical protein
MIVFSLYYNILSYSKISTYLCEFKCWLYGITYDVSSVNVDVLDNVTLYCTLYQYQAQEPNTDGNSVRFRYKLEKWVKRVL